MIVWYNISERAKELELQENEEVERKEEQTEKGIKEEKFMLKTMITIRKGTKEIVEKKPPKKVKDKELIKQRKKERKENKNTLLPGKEGAIQYLDTWMNDRDNWKFKKSRQVFFE